MKKETIQKIVYSAVNLLVIALVIAADVSVAASRYTYRMSGFLFMLNWSEPVVIPILISLKALFQLKVPVLFSKIINSAGILLLVVGVIVFYDFSDLFFFVSISPMFILIFTFQLCSLIYDFFFRKCHK